MVEQCNLTSRFPNVFVQGLNLAKNRPTSLIWTEVCVPFKILMWTLLAYERRLNILLLRCVYLLHEAKYLQV